MVSIMVVGIGGNFFKLTLEGRHDEMCSMNLDLCQGLVISQKLWTIVHELLCGPSKKQGIMVIHEPWPNAYGVNMP
jgi:hypothetical protein